MAPITNSWLVSYNFLSPYTMATKQNRTLYPSEMTVKHKGKQYVVLNLHYKGDQIPVILDSYIHRELKKLDKQWYVNDKGYIYSTHVSDGEPMEIYIHDVAMKIHNALKGDREKIRNKSIIHLNRICLDNRIENLVYDDPNKEVTKNLNKKKRYVDRPVGGLFCFWVLLGFNCSILLFFSFKIIKQKMN